MECPKCGIQNHFKTIDSRHNGPLGGIRRRKECVECGRRFTTYELRKDQLDFEDDTDDEYVQEDPDMTAKDIFNTIPSHIIDEIYTLIDAIRLGHDVSTSKLNILLRLNEDQKSVVEEIFKRSERR